MGTKRRDPVAALRRLAQRIRAQREQCGFSQERAAGDAGMSVRHYQKIEGGSVDVRFTSLMAVAGALQTTVGDLADY